MGRLAEDHQIKTINKELMKLLESRDTKALTYIEMLESMGAERGDIDLIGYALYRYAYYYYFTTPDSDKFRTNLRQAIKYLLKSQDKEYLGGAYNLVAYDAVDQGFFDIAYAYFVMALEALEDKDDISLPGLIEANAGRLMLELGDYQTGYERIKHSIEKIASFTDMYFYNYNMVLTYCEMALAAFLMRDADALASIKESIEEYTAQASDEEIALSKPYYLLSGVYQALLTGDDDALTKNFGDLIAFWKSPESSDLTGVIFEIETLCSFMLEKDYIKQAKDILETAQSLENDDSVNVVIQYLSLKINYFEKIHDIDKLKEYLFKMHEARKLERADSIRMKRYAMEFADMVEQIARERGQYYSSK